jgi:hypothetical protein
MRIDELRPLPIFEGLTDQQLAELIEGGSEVPIQPGVDLFREGSTRTSGGCWSRVP